MSNFEFHDYHVENMEPYTSDMLNKITSDFTNNIVTLYSQFRTLVGDYNNYHDVVNIGLDWLTSLASSLSLPNYYALTGYEDPTSNENVTLSKLYGQIYLGEMSKESKIGRYLNDQGKYIAYISNKVYKYVTGNWVEDIKLKKIIDNQNNIWSDEIDEDELYISVAISGSDLENKANIIEVVPFAGTLIKKIEWKTSSGSYEQVLPNSKFPVKIVGDFDFANEIRVLMGGAPKGSKYYYSLRYIDIHRSDFRDEGHVTYSITNYATDKSMTEISDMILNTDYIREDLKLKTPIRIQVIKDSIVVYDTKDDPFPLESSIDISGFTTLDIKILLYKTESISPVIKYIDIS